MNKLILIIIIFLILSTAVFSAPNVSYILPDIGAPGMNVYVEIVAPYNQKGTFGLDGLFMNNEGDKFRVKPQNIDDEKKIKVGPVVVSWNGRLLSTQIFVNPELNPNSTDALILNPEFRIPLVVVKDGEESSTVTFYIVKSRPYFDGNLFPNDTVFGEGSLGLRSPRGAMIFDSIRLGNHKYTVSTQDCDPNIAGNQGYLPFTLLVRGKLEGNSNNGDYKSVIDVSAVRINGGPGGGGGGGRYYDAFLTALNENGDDGGNGFVGGGAGGRNRSGLGTSDAYKSQGQGSGANGNSLNLVPFPANMAYESAAGGTGHPFGESGVSCSDGANCAPEGAYGAGSGRSQNKQGGSAGHNTAGTGASSGYPVGNEMNIPLSGGSGGAGGNPNFPGAYSGNGGGGGGAMSVFASQIKNINFVANGAAGSPPSGGVGNVSYGGNGAGGMVNLSSKSTIEGVKADVIEGAINGTRGGYGRVRFDCNHFQETPQTEHGAYFGMRSDSTQYVSSVNNQIYFNQAKPGNNITSKVFGASFDGNWVDLGSSISDPIATSSLAVSLDPANKYYCLVFMQDVPNPKTDEFLTEPNYAMSQAAANLIILDLNPILVADTVASNMAITCKGYERRIFTTIKNDDAAGGDLNINFSNNNWIFGNNGFEIVSPLGDVTIKPGDSVVLIVKYIYTGGDQVNISNRLYFNHNDPSKKNPWTITFRVGDAFLAGMRLEGDFVFPDTRIGGKTTRIFDLRNMGDAPLLIEEILPIDPPFYVVGTTPDLPAVLKADEVLKIQVEFRPTEEKDYSNPLNMNSMVTDTTCAFFAYELLSGKGVVSQIDVNTNLIDFGLVAWCDEKEEIIQIQNPSTAALTFVLTSDGEIIGKDADAFVISNPKTAPMTITPGDGVQFKIKINGKQAGSGARKAKFVIETDMPEMPTISVELVAEIADFRVVANQSPINLGDIELGFSKDATINLTNLGILEEELASVITASAANFNILNISDNLIAPNGGQINIDFTYTAIDTNPDQVVTLIFDSPCNDTLVIPVNVNYLIAKESAENLDGKEKFYLSDSKVDTLDFGKLSSCQTPIVDGILYTNETSARYIVLNESITNLNGSAFDIIGNGLLNDTIQPAMRFGKMQMNFIPTGLSEGVYIAEYKATLFINGKIVEKRIILKGEVVEGKLEVNPLAYNFQSVVGLSEEVEFTLKNIGAFDIDMTNIILPEYPIFEVSPDLSNVIIKTGEEQKFTIKFSPIDVAKYADSLKLTFETGDCTKEEVLYFNGSGDPSKKLMVYVPKLFVEPTMNNYKIPIYAKLDKKEDILDNFGIDTISVTMRRSMFYPTNITNGELINSYQVGDNRVVIFKINDIHVTASDSLISEIVGYTMLGDTNYTDIIIDNIMYSNKVLVSSVTSENGSMETEICEEGGDRLLSIQGKGNGIVVNPNPAVDNININVNSIENGNYIISIIDELGRENIITKWLNNSQNNRNFIIENSNLGVGTYLIKMITPTEILTTRLVIIK